MEVSWAQRCRTTQPPPVIHRNRPPRTHSSLPSFIATGHHKRNHLPSFIATDHHKRNHLPSFIATDHHKRIPPPVIPA